MMAPVAAELFIGQVTHCLCIAAALLCPACVQDFQGLAHSSDLPCKRRQIYPQYAKRTPLMHSQPL